MVEILSYQSTFQKAALSARKLYFPNVHLALTKIWQTGCFHSVSVDFFEVAPRLKLGFCGWSSYDIGAEKFPKPSPWFSGTTCEVSPPWKLNCISQKICRLMRDLGGEIQDIGQRLTFSKQGNPAELRSIRLNKAANSIPKNMVQIFSQNIHWFQLQIQEIAH